MYGFADYTNMPRKFRHSRPKNYERKKQRANKKVCNSIHIHHLPFIYFHPFPSGDNTFSNPPSIPLAFMHTHILINSDVAGVTCLHACIASRMD